MRSRSAILAMAALTAASIFVRSIGAQQSGSSSHPHYKLVVLGPLGGPTSGPGGSLDGGAGGWFLGGLGSLSNFGSALVAADTPVADPFSGLNIFHAYRWQNGFITHLDPLPTQPDSAGNNGYPNAVNIWGLAAGVSENGFIDPVTGFQQLNAVVWTPQGKVQNLGTLGGLESEATLVNNLGEVVGWAENTIPDPFSFAGDTQVQGFTWKGGAIVALPGFPGGGGSIPSALNDRGQVVGCADTDTDAPNGFVPFAPALWQNGKALNLGNFGGTGGCAAWINMRGQIVGYSNVPGDERQHAFLWQPGSFKDLGTLGGPDSGAFVINDAGDIIGFSDLAGPDPIFHGVVWRNGHIHDLKTLDGDSCSQALDINARGQIVGSSGPCDLDDAFGQHHATLWSGSTLVDLNSLIPPDSGIVLVWAFTINDCGEIGGFALLPNGDPRAYVLIPEDGNGFHGDCASDPGANPAVTPQASASRAAAHAAVTRAPANSARALAHARQAHMQRGKGFIGRIVN